MRALLLCCGLALALGGCPLSPKPQPVKPRPQLNPDWPANYRTWKKVNATTILNEDEEVAREIYSNGTPGLGQGTVLVKEQYALANGAKGPLQFVAVMRRTGGSANNGWEFLAFDPRTKKKNEE